MQHLDDRLIAEYLDGETPSEPVERHLTECRACAARVDEARTVRAHARDILGDAGPRDVSTPPFGDVLARAGRPAPRSRRRVSARALAWAATIALSFGAGWWLRRPTLVRTPASTELSPMVTMNRPAPNVPTTEDTASLAAPTAKPDAGSAAASGNGAAPTAATSGEAPAQAEKSSKASPVPATPAARAAEQRNTQDAALKVPQAAPEPIPTEQVRQASATPPSALSVVDGRHDFTTLANATGIAAMAWTVSSRAEAERVLGAPVHVIRGLDAIYATGVMGGTPVVRIEQRLADGDVVSLLEQRVENATATGRNAPMPRPMTGVKFEFRKAGVLIQASAPVSVDSLARLIAQLD